MVVIGVLLLVLLMKGYNSQTDLVCPTNQQLIGFQIAIYDISEKNDEYNKYMTSNPQNGLSSIRILCWNSYKNDTPSTVETTSAFITANQNQKVYFSPKRVNYGIKQYVDNNRIIKQSSGDQYFRMGLGAYQTLGYMKQQQADQRIITQFSTTTIIPKRLFSKQTTSVVAMSESPTTKIQKPIVGLTYTASSTNTQSNLAIGAMKFTDTLTESCILDDPKIQKFIDSSSKCQRCNPKSNCLTCDQSDSSKCLTCDQFDILNNITNTCVVNAKLGIFEKLLLDGYDPTSEPTSGFLAADVSKFTVSGQLSGSSTPQTQKCSNTYIMGGPGHFGKGTELKITLADLIGHSSIRVKFTFYKFGDWHNSSLFYTVDGNEPNRLEQDQLYYKQEGGYESHFACEDVANIPATRKYNSRFLSAGNIETILDFNSSHYQKDLELVIKSDIGDPPSALHPPAYWGLRDFHIFYTECHFLCKWCIGDTQYDCINCEPKFILRNKQCVCKPRHYRVIPPGCEHNNCTSCIPCNPACGDCDGPTTVDCKNCLPTQFMVEKQAGIIECVDKCPPGTYLNINYCVSCGKICDVNTPVTIATPNSYVNPINAIIIKVENTQSIVFIQKGLHSYQQVFKLHYDNQKWQLQSLQVMKDNSNNISPFNKDIVLEISRVLAVYPNGVFVYDLDRYQLQLKSHFPASCQNMIAFPEYYLCTDFNSKKLYKISKYLNETLKTCDLQNFPYSLYVSPMKKDQVWIGSLNAIYTLNLYTCGTIQNFQVTSNYNDLKIKYILSDNYYNNYVIVVIGFYSKLSQIVLTTYAFQGIDNSDLSKLSQVKQTFFSIMTINLNDFYTLNGMLVPQTDIVVISNKLNIYQMNYMTHEKYSAFYVDDQTNYLVNLFDSQLFLRHHQSLTSESKYLWFSYPCMQNQLQKGDILCHKCDSPYILQNGKCIQHTCATNFIFSNKTNQCVIKQSAGYSQMIPEVVLQTDLHLNDAIQYQQTNTHFNILLKTNGSKVYYIQVAVTSYQISFIHVNNTFYKDPLESSYSLSTPANYDLTSQMLEYNSKVVNNVGCISMVYILPLDPTKLNQVVTHQIQCNSLKKIANQDSYLCAISQQSKVQEFKLDKTKVYECNVESEVYSMEVNSKGDSSHVYIWMGSNNIVYIYDRIKASSQLQSYQCQQKSKFVIDPKNPNLNVVSIICSYGYSDCSVVIVVAIDSTNKLAVINQYLSQNYKYHTYNYKLNNQLNLDLKQLDLSDVKVRQIPKSDQMQLIVKDKIFVINEGTLRVDDVLIDSYFSYKSINPIKTGSQLQLIIQQNHAANQTVFNVVHSYSLCKKYKGLAQCSTCQKGYMTNLVNKDNCEIGQCILDKFIKDDDKCMIPIQFKLLVIDYVNYPFLFNIRILDSTFEELFSNIEISDKKYHNIEIVESDKSSVKSSDFSYSVSKVQSDIFQVRIDWNINEFKPSNQIIYSFIGTNIKKGYGLQNNKFIIKVGKTYKKCDIDKQYYDSESQKCADKVPIQAQIALINNPLVFQLTLDKYSKHLNQYLIQQKPFQILIQGLVFMKDYQVDVEEYEIEQKTIYISIHYSKQAKVSKDAKISIRFDIVYVQQVTVDLTKLNKEFKAKQYQEPESEDCYFDEETGKIAKRQKLEQKVQSGVIPNSLILELNNTKSVKDLSTILILKLDPNMTTERQLQQTQTQQYKDISYSITELSNKKNLIQIKYSGNQESLLQASLQFSQQKYVNRNNAFVYPKDKIRVIIKKQQVTQLDENISFVFNLFNILMRVVGFCSIVVDSQSFFVLEIGLVFNTILRLGLINVQLPTNADNIYRGGRASISEKEIKSGLDYNMQLYGINVMFLQNLMVDLLLMVSLIIIVLLMNILKKKYFREWKRVIHSKDADQISKLQKKVIKFGNIYQVFVWNATAIIFIASFQDAIFYSEIRITQESGDAFDLQIAYFTNYFLIFVMFIFYNYIHLMQYIYKFLGKKMFQQGEEVGCEQKKEQQQSQEMVKDQDEQEQSQEVVKDQGKENDENQISQKEIDKHLSQLIFIDYLDIEFIQLLDQQDLDKNCLDIDLNEQAYEQAKKEKMVLREAQNKKRKESGEEDKTFTQSVRGVIGKIGGFFKSLIGQSSPNQDNQEYKQDDIEQSYQQRGYQDSYSSQHRSSQYDSNYSTLRKKQDYDSYESSYISRKDDQQQDNLVEEYQINKNSPHNQSVFQQQSHAEDEYEDLNVIQEINIYVRKIIQRIINPTQANYKQIILQWQILYKDLKHQKITNYIMIVLLQTLFVANYMGNQSMEATNQSFNVICIFVLKSIAIQLMQPYKSSKHNRLVALDNLVVVCISFCIWQFSGYDKYGMQYDTRMYRVVFGWFMCANYVIFIVFNMTYLLSQILAKYKSWKKTKLLIQKGVLIEQYLKKLDTFYINKIGDDEINDEKFINGLQQIVIRLDKRIAQLKQERNVLAINKLENYQYKLKLYYKYIDQFRDKKMDIDLQLLDINITEEEEHDQQQQSQHQSHQQSQQQQTRQDTKQSQNSSKSKQSARSRESGKVQAKSGNLDLSIIKENNTQDQHNEENLSFRNPDQFDNYEVYNEEINFDDINMEGTDSNQESSDGQTNNQTINQNRNIIQHINNQYDSEKSKSTKNSARINLDKIVKK